MIHSRWPVRRFCGERSLIVANEPAAIEAVLFRFRKRKEKKKKGLRRSWEDGENSLKKEGLERNSERMCVSGI